MKVNIGGSLKPVTSAKINVAGALKVMSRVRHNVAGALKDGASFYVALSASASPNPAYGTAVANPVYSSAVTVTPSGGYAPYTYSWAKIAGVGSITSSTSATTTFYASVAPDTPTDGVFRCTITDSHSSTFTIDVTCTFERSTFGGP